MIRVERRRWGRGLLLDLTLTLPLFLNIEPGLHGAAIEWTRDPDR